MREFYGEPSTCASPFLVRYAAGRIFARANRDGLAKAIELSTSSQPGSSAANGAMEVSAVPHPHQNRLGAVTFCFPCGMRAPLRQTNVCCTEQPHAKSHPEAHTKSSIRSKKRAPLLRRGQSALVLSLCESLYEALMLGLRRSIPGGGLRVRLLRRAYW